MGELNGIGGYASLMKTQKNPFDRNLASTQAVLNTMPKDGGVSGFEGLGKIPLMYQMGVDSANAAQFDEQKAAEEQKTMQGVMAYQREQEAAKLKLEQEKGAADINAKNANALQDTLKTAVELSKSGNEGEAVKLLNSKGIPAQNFTVDEHGVMSQMTNGVFWRMGKTGVTVWDTDNKAWRPANDADSEALKKEKFSITTGYKDGQHATYKLDNNTGDVEVIGKAPIKVAGDGSTKEKDPANKFKRVLLPGAAEHTVFDVTKPEGLQGYNTAIHQGGTDVTGAVASYNVTGSKAVANNEHPKPGKQISGISAMIKNGQNPVAASGGNSAENVMPRPQKKGGAGAFSGQVTGTGAKPAASGGNSAPNVQAPVGYTYDPQKGYWTNPNAPAGKQAWRP